MINDFLADLLKHINNIAEELHDLKYQMLSEDLLISYQYASVYRYQSVK